MKNPFKNFDADYTLVNNMLEVNLYHAIDPDKDMNLMIKDDRAIILLEDMGIGQYNEGLIKIEEERGNRIIEKSMSLEIWLQEFSNSVTLKAFAKRYFSQLEKQLNLQNQKLRAA